MEPWDLQIVRTSHGFTFILLYIGVDTIVYE